MKPIFVRSIASLSLLTSVVAICFGNDGWYSAGGAPFNSGKKHPTVQMLDEDLNIVMDDEKARVTVDYIFKNHGSATQATMAFPEEFAGPTRGAYNWIRSWVDGKEVKLAKTVVKEVGRLRDGGSNAWLKKVSFAKGQQRRVRVQYETYYAGDTVGNRNLYYILATGATWRGSIARCKITVDWSRMRKLSRPELSIRNHWVEWEATGPKRRSTTLLKFEPKGDLSISMVGQFWSFVVNGKRVPQEAISYFAPGIIVGKGEPVIAVEFISAFLKGSGDPRFTTLGKPKMESGRLFLGDKLVGALSRKPFIRATGVDRWRREFIYLKDLAQILGGTMTFRGDTYYLEGVGK